MATSVNQHQKGETYLDVNETSDNGVAVASAGPYANPLHLTPDRQPRQHFIIQFFTGQMFFLMPIQ